MAPKRRNGTRVSYCPDTSLNELIGPMTIVDRNDSNEGIGEMEWTNDTNENQALRQDYVDRQVTGGQIDHDDSMELGQKGNQNLSDRKGKGREVIQSRERDKENFDSQSKASTSKRKNPTLGTSRITTKKAALPKVIFNGILPIGIEKTTEYRQMIGIPGKTPHQIEQERMDQFILAQPRHHRSPSIEARPPIRHHSISPNPGSEFSSDPADPDQMITISGDTDALQKTLGGFLLPRSGLRKIIEESQPHEAQQKEKEKKDLAEAQKKRRKELAAAKRKKRKESAKDLAEARKKELEDGEYQLDDTSDEAEVEEEMEEEIDELDSDQGEEEIEIIPRGERIESEIEELVPKMRREYNFDCEIGKIPVGIELETRHFDNTFESINLSSALTPNRFRAELLSLYLNLMKEIVSKRWNEKIEWRSVEFYFHYIRNYINSNSMKLSTEEQAEKIIKKLVEIFELLIPLVENWENGSELSEERLTEMKLWQFQILHEMVSTLIEFSQLETLNEFSIKLISSNLRVYLSRFIRCLIELDPKLIWDRISTCETGAVLDSVMIEGWNFIIQFTLNSQFDSFTELDLWELISKHLSNKVPTIDFIEFNNLENEFIHIMILVCKLSQFNSNGVTEDKIQLSISWEMVIKQFQLISGFELSVEILSEPAYEDTLLALLSLCKTLVDKFGLRLSTEKGGMMEKLLEILFLRDVSIDDGSNVPIKPTSKFCNFLKSFTVNDSTRICTEFEEGDEISDKIFKLLVDQIQMEPENLESLIIRVHQLIEPKLQSSIIESNETKNIEFGISPMIHFYSIYIIFQHFLPRESEFVFHYSNELSNLFNSLIKSKNISFLIIRILQFIWNQIKLLEIQIDQRLLENWIINIVKISIIKFDKKHFELCIRIAKIVTEDCAKIWKRIQLEGNPTILFVSPTWTSAILSLSIPEMWQLQIQILKSMHHHLVVTFSSGADSEYRNQLLEYMLHFNESIPIIIKEFALPEVSKFEDPLHSTKFRVEIISNLVNFWILIRKYILHYSNQRNSQMQSDTYLNRQIEKLISSVTSDVDFENNSQVKADKFEEFRDQLFKEMNSLKASNYPRTGMISRA